MKEYMLNIFYIAFAILALIIAVDFAIEFRHVLQGTPRAKKVFETILADKDQTIDAQKITIKELQHNLRNCRTKIKALEREASEAEEKTETEEKTEEETKD